MKYLSRFFVLTLLWLIAFNGAAQNPDHVTTEFIDLTFEGGNAGYMEFFEKNLVYPKVSYQDQIEGLLLFSFTIDTESPEIAFQFYTKLDERIEASVKKTVQASRPKWTIRTPGKYTVFQPIIFSLLPYYPEILEGDLPPIPQALPNKYQQLFVFIKSKRIPEGYSLETSADDAAASEKVKTMYIRTQQAYEKALEAERYETAYRLLNKLIRYNPLDKDYLMKRIELEKKVETREFQAYDAMLLNDFVATMTPLDSYETNEAYYDGPEVDLPKPMEHVENNTWTIMEKVYEGGNRAFLRHFSQYYQLPSVQYLIKTEGVLLIEMKSDLTGQIRARLLNTFNSGVSKGLENALLIMSKNWKKVDEPFHKILPYYISPKESISQNLALILEDYEVAKNDLFIDPWNVSGLYSASTFGEKTEANDAEKAELKRTSELYAKYVNALAEYEAQLKKGKSKKAIQALNTALQLNPYSIDLLEKRLAMNEKKLNAKYREYDQDLLEILKSLK